MDKQVTTHLISGLAGGVLAYVKARKATPEVDDD
jgi:hypothetical protein